MRSNVQTTVVEFFGDRYEERDGELHYLGHFSPPAPDPDRVAALLAKTAARKAPQSGSAHVHGNGCGCPGYGNET